ncbi:threonylcarbamoyl-AMP synthase [Aerococcus urinaehominis]|uniref:Threonylcarbamoyl-AMP synthase n=1 Tax=Aerococcus urinaehominis TaxID=128944 RepID=A0A0X8FK35_9LACT|nr:L-threonylcarbamoyladenylate synthase [Aerococcus urinaehominis]AMB98760.1 threonylcarbamoyl-AMP synthase [Aerococcus urinaehominis]SDM13753.1 L-threonylcarbamoyladenylate synthase [Aerococcus urinaehominis]
MTEIFNQDTLDQAAALLKQGKLVAFPTETVFGLGAIANNADAVSRVYQVKGRPSDNPLIVHVADPSDIFKYAGDLSDQQTAAIEALTSRFWPGPLTLIVPAKLGIFPSVVRGGLETVGIRMPNHPLTLDLIKRVGFPLVGPSANISGKPSPTTVDHVIHDFDGKIAGVLASQPTDIGVESTVLDLSEPGNYYILRPGAITQDMIEAEVDLITITTNTNQINPDQAPKAPGMKYRHYSPSQTVVAVAASKIDQYLSNLPEKQDVALALLDDQLAKVNPDNYGATYALGSSSRQATQRLFAALRTFDDQKHIKTIVVSLLADQEGNQAYRNRLLKAASRVVE